MHGYAEQPVKLATLDFKPFIWCEGSQAKGLYAEIIAELFLRIGREYTIECFPWKRALYEVENGMVDALFAGVKTERREQFAIFTKMPIRIGQYSVFTRKTDPFTYQTVSDLFGKTVAISRGHSVSLEFDSAVRFGAIKLVEVKSTNHGMRLLLAGRVEAYINDTIVGLFEANKMSITSEIQVLEVPVQRSNPAFLLFSKASPLENKEEMISAIDQRLQTMWADGTIENVYNQYIGEIQLPSLQN